jgi:hypothetical protein
MLKQCVYGLGRVLLVPREVSSLFHFDMGTDWSHCKFTVSVFNVTKIRRKTVQSVRPSSLETVYKFMSICIFVKRALLSGMWRRVFWWHFLGTNIDQIAEPDVPEGKSKYKHNLWTCTKNMPRRSTIRKKKAFECGPHTWRVAILSVPTATGVRGGGGPRSANQVSRRGSCEGGMLRSRPWEPAER